MIVKGLIKSIDYNGNTCVVRIPLFETASNDNEVEITATFATLPGIYNGYKENDVVFVGFENNIIDKPVVLGKLYLGADTESKEARGAINCDNFKSIAPISIPIDTKLTLDNDSKNLTSVNVDNGLNTYKTIADLAKNLQKQETQIGSINVKMIDDGENWGAEIQRLTNENVLQTSKINQNAESITAEVTRASQAEGELDSKITQTAEDITAEVNKKVPTESGAVERGLSWILNTERWEVDANDTIDPDTGLPATTLPLMTLDRSGMVIYGNLVLAGYPKTTEIKYARNQNANEHPADNEFTHDTTEGLYAEGYYTWKRTREVFYEYNAETDRWELTKYGLAKYECITGATGSTGEPATTYWTKLSSRFHLGTNQENPIEATPYAKTGGEGERVDTGAYFKYSLDNGATWNSDDWTLITTQTNNKVVIAANSLTAKDLIIKFAHKYTDPGTSQVSYEEYEVESVTYSPLNTPVIDLDNDSDAIKYNPNGTKATGSGSVYSDAQVLLGGSEEPATYTWACTSGTAVLTTSNSGKTIEVSDVSTAKAILTCSATTTNFKDESGNYVTVTKDFTVSREVVVASYWLSFPPVHTGNLQQTAIEIKALAKIGNDAEGPDTNAYLRYSWNNGATWAINWTKPADGILIIAANTVQNSNLRVQATHDTSGTNRQTYEDEIITYSPLNTPIIDLSQDSATLPYDGNSKIGAGNVSSTAEVWLNGQTLPSSSYTVTWAAVNSSCTISQNSNTVTVSAIANNVNTAIARCTITNITNYPGTILTKDFIITKALKGDTGKAASSYWVDIDHDVHTGRLQTEDIEIYAYKQIGFDSTIEVDTEVTLTATAGTFTKTATGHLTILATEINNSTTPITTNITVVATRNSVDYETEIIEYSADTPLISLSNDGGVIKVDKNGTIVVTTSTQPKLYVKGQVITSGINFTWSPVPATASVLSDGTLIVNDITGNSCTFTCSVTYNGETYRKNFNVTKILDGTDGYSTAVVALYTRNSNTPSNPINRDLYYKFATQKLYTDTSCSTEFTLPSGWVYTIAEAGGAENGNLYCITAAVSSNDVADTINSSEWVGPVLYTQNGATGVGISETKQWYILWPEDAADTPDLPDGSIPEEYTEIIWGDADYPASAEDWQAGGRYVYYQGNYIEITPENYAEYDAIHGFDGGWTPYRKNSEATRTWYDHPLESVNGYVMWTSLETIFDDNIATNPHYEFSNPVKDAAYALAQGKSTNYYSANDPATDHSVKKGDCWFITPEGTTNGYWADGKPGQNRARDYIGNYYKVGDNYYKITNATSNSTGVLTLTYAINGVEQSPVTFNDYSSWPEQYKTNILLEWDGSNWKDVEGETVTNKLTANYINALDITAKKITVLKNNNDIQNSDNPILFQADGLSDNGYVEIAGWKVNENSLYNDKATTPKPGDLGSTWFSVGATSDISIGGSTDTKKDDWVLTAGDQFGLDKNGNVYASGATLNASIFKSTTNLEDSTKKYPTALLTALSNADDSSKEVELKSGGAIPKKLDINLKIDVGWNLNGNMIFGYDEEHNYNGNGPIENMWPDGSLDSHIFHVAITLEDYAPADLKIPLSIVCPAILYAQSGTNIPELSGTNYFFQPKALLKPNISLIAPFGALVNMECWDLDSDIGANCNCDVIIKKDTLGTVITVGMYSSQNPIGIATLRGNQIYIDKNSIWTSATTTTKAWEGIPGTTNDIGGSFYTKINLEKVPDLLVTGNILPDYTWTPITEKQIDGNKETIITSYTQQQLKENTIGAANLPWSYGYFNYLQATDGIKSSTIETIWKDDDTVTKIGTKEHPFDEIYVRNIYYLREADGGGLHECYGYKGDTTDPWPDDKIAIRDFEKNGKPLSYGWKWVYDFESSTATEHPISTGKKGGSEPSNAVGLATGYNKLAVSVKNTTTPTYSYYYCNIPAVSDKKLSITVTLLTNGTWMTDCCFAINSSSTPSKDDITQDITHNTPYKVTLSQNTTGKIWLKLGGKKQDGWDQDFRDLAINIEYLAIDSDSGGSSSGGGIGGGSAPIGGGCFEAGTKVTMADNTEKNIEEIKAGDEVLSYNINTKKLEPKKVLDTYEIRQRINLVRLYFSDGTVLDTTINHPFYTTDGWVSLMPNYDYDDTYEDLQNQLVEMMQVGQLFYILANNEVKVVRLIKIKYRHGYKDGHCVYNLKIEDFNTFFTNGILGHNRKENQLTALQLN